MKRGVIIVTIISVIFLIVAGFHIWTLRYYRYNKYNVYAKNAVMEMLSVKYQTRFKILSVDYEMIEKRVGGARFIHIWTYHLCDEEGREFDAFKCGYGVEGKGDGCLYADDYYNYRTDTYGQIRIEECLNEKYDLTRFRCSKDISNQETDDYHFICTGENAEMIADMITDIVFEEITFCSEGGIICSVSDESGNEILSISQGEIKSIFKKESLEMTYDNVQNYIMDVLSTREE